MTYSKIQSFILINKKGKEIINKIDSNSLSQAIKMFATIKQIRPDQLLKIYTVYEESKYGR